MKVIFKQEAHEKIMYWVNRSNFEVSGLGLVTVDQEKKIFTVEDVILVKQENGATHTDIEAEDVARAMYELRNTQGNLNFWWHSHVDMDVFWSGTDKATIQDIGKGGWFLSTVFNKRGEMKSALYVIDGRKTPFGVSPLFIDDIENKIDTPAKPLNLAWEKEYTDKVTIKTYSAPMVTGSQWWQDNQAWEDVYGIRGRHKEEKTPLLMADGYPAHRPAGMSRREWKRIKKIRKSELKSEAEVTGQSSDEPLDHYGYTQGQWEFLGSVGVDIREVDTMLSQGFSTNEILEYFGFQEENYETDLDDLELDDLELDAIDAEVIDAENETLH